MIKQLLGIRFKQVLKVVCCFCFEYTPDYPGCRIRQKTFGPFVTFLIQGAGRSCSALILIWAAVMIFTGCQTTGAYRVDVDEKALDIIAEKQEQVLGMKKKFSIDRPGDMLRRQLLEHASLPVTGPASLGTDQLSPVDHWPEPGFPEFLKTGNQGFPISDGLLEITLFQALKIGAQNNSDFQTKKEAVFQAALALYLEQDSFRNTLLGQIQSLASSDASKEPSQRGTLTSSKTEGSRQFQNGMTLTTALAIDLATLLTSGGSSSIGIAGDASLSIPLLRGSAKHIVTEPLQQAERNVVYAIMDFERFKKEFAVSVGSRYLTILKQLDAVKNTEEDYRSRIVSARRSSRLADAGRLKEIEVDQSVQNELVARQRWISAREEYKQQMDSFKILLGLPPDADISLDTDELKHLAAILAGKLSSEIAQENEEVAQERNNLPADAPVRLTEPDQGNAGPLELDARKATELALANRLDMQIALGRVFDAQRTVVVAADDLGAELTLLGSASLGERRTITTADLANARLRTDKGVFSALLTLDLPFERTAEAVTYRNSFIELEKAVRAVQDLEDNVKLFVRSRLRDLLEARETLHIQAKAVLVALKRVKSINLFMDAGRAETRDLLEAQDALLSAQLSLTSARVNYRIAELEIQRDMGVLKVTDTGMWQEYSLEKDNNAEK
ncbi:TolC family protein [Desulfobacula phenolica]|uniref:Outer membrane efflux protein n=1 Tax=Desulfobacula phenolica TaxID=90732 RepID=A0A1H2IMQ4_9BACT|nr:TolC family protein [Desulfobacula phenolica]SDU45301.1 Outer membrane efflux protein [Desulfobacula phenolica]